MLKLYCVILMFSLSGCSAVFSDQEIESDCFPAFTQEAILFFDELYNHQAYLSFVNNNAPDTPFLVENGINGFLSLHGTTAPMESIGEREKLNFTGRVFKKWPSWGEYYIGGSKKHIKLEVIVKGKGYLLFDTYIPNAIENKLPSRCTFK